MRNPKSQISVRALLVLIFCCGAVAWAWRNVGETRREPSSTGDWIRLLDSADVDERKLALRRLDPSGASEMDAALSAADRAMKDTDAQIRMEAAVAQTRFATSPPPKPGTADVDRARRIARRLNEAFRDDPDVGVRASAATGLSTIFTALVKAGIRPAELPADDPLKPEGLVVAFDAGLQKDQESRVPLITSIGRLGKVSMPAPPGVLSVLDEPTHFVRGQALLALSHFSGGVDRAIPVLLRDVVTNTDRFPPDYASIAAAMRPSPAVVPALLEALKSTNGIVRETASTLLSHVDPAPRTAAPAVIAVVNEQLSARQATGEVEDVPDREPPAGNGAVTPNAGIRREQPAAGLVSPDLAVTLARVAPPGEAVPLLLQLLKRKDPASWSAAADGLAEIGPAAHEAVPVLLGIMKEVVAGEGRNASGYGARTARALGRIAPLSPEAKASSQDLIGVLGAALKLRPPSIRSSAARALGNFGPMAAPALPGLQELLQAREADVRDAADSAIKKIDAKASPAQAVKPS